MAYPISDVTRRIVYSGSAGVGPYSFSFEVLEQTDVAVYKNTTLLTLTTDYTVTLNVDGTGSVTLVSAATASDQITLVGDRAVARSTDFVTGGDLFANSLNDEFDSLVIFAQQIKETADRGLKAAITDPTDVNMTLPLKDDRKGKVLAFDSTTGDPISGPALDSMITVIAQSANINTVADNIVDIQNAEENADAAIAAKNAAELIETSVTNIYNSFDTTYLGSKASAPTLDNAGNPLVAGAMYYNTSVGSEGLYVYDGSNWVSQGNWKSSVTLSFNGAGSAIPQNSEVETIIPFDCVLQTIDLIADATYQVDATISYATLAAYPTMTTLTTISNTSGYTATKTVSHSFSKGDVVRVKITNAPSFTERATYVFNVVRT